MLRQLLVLLLPLAPVLVPTAASALGPYSVTDLGTLGGTSSYGTAINDLGHAVGYSTLAGGETRAFLWTPGGGMQNLGVLGSGDSQALDINNNENVVGVTSNQAFRWTSPLGMVLIDSANSGSANGLNANDEAIGYRVAGVNSRARTWTASNVVGNPYPISDLRGVAINDLGQFVSTDTGPTGGIYSPGSGLFTLLGNFIPTDMNNNRLISGSITGIAAALDFDTNTTTMLGKLAPTDSFSQALGVNANGTIVGVSQGSGGFIADSSLTSIISLTSLLDPSFTGWNILTAEDINSAGQIIGVGEFGGVSHAVILTPVPEPSSAILAALACCGMWFLRRRSA